jgi:hypothetical protein
MSAGFLVDTSVVSWYLDRRARARHPSVGKTEPRFAFVHARTAFGPLARFARLTADRKAWVRRAASSGLSKPVPAPPLGRPPRAVPRSATATFVIVTPPRPADCRTTKVHRPFRAMATQSRKRHAALVGLPYFFS